ncbi:YfhJ family protein [Mesobacillus maritimus]|uniref:YfhJ family protein n=1 Tax=Mesobacillus maritimus TaxID=1643336 RepID=A0ABS7K6W4_9BACI|nr:YfhJ family protein [Mesobacillus maritimus]MBY0098021.1 YfhJ family protein [Mesobacillus maritimus]
MNEYHERLANLLVEKNHNISYQKALTWVELLWDDFETTSAKAGREYLGNEMTEKVVTQWIQHYGDKLHDFVARNPKYKHFLEQEKDLH